MVSHPLLWRQARDGKVRNRGLLTAFSITVEAAKCLICTRIEGLRSIYDTRRLAEQSAVGRLTECANVCGLPVDLTDYAFHQQDVVQAFQTVISSTPRRVSRLAIVTQSALLRMQFSGR